MNILTLHRNIRSRGKIFHRSILVRRKVLNVEKLGFVWAVVYLEQLCISVKIRNYILV